MPYLRLTVDGTDYTVAEYFTDDQYEKVSRGWVNSSYAQILPIDSSSFTFDDTKRYIGAAATLDATGKKITNVTYLANPTTAQTRAALYRDTFLPKMGEIFSYMGGREAAKMVQFWDDSQLRGVDNTSDWPNAAIMFGGLSMPFSDATWALLSDSNKVEIAWRNTFAAAYFMGYTAITMADGDKVGTLEREEWFDYFRDFDPNFFYQNHDPLNFLNNMMAPNKAAILGDRNAAGKIEFRAGVLGRQTANAAKFNTVSTWT